MKTLLAILILAGAFLVVSVQGQTNLPAVTNIAAQTAPISNAPVVINAPSPATNTVVVILGDDARKLMERSAQDSFIKKTLFGAIIATLVGVAAEFFREWRERRRKKGDEERFERNTILAIRRELEAMGKLYAEGMGAQVDNTPIPKILPVTFALTEDWFTVYNANAGNLGRIDADISRRIIQCYTLVKGLIETFRINNSYLAAYKQKQETREPWGANMAEQLMSMTHIQEDRRKAQELLEEHYIKIQEAAAKLKAEVNELFAILDERGIK